MAISFKIEGLEEILAKLTAAPQIVIDEIRMQLKTELTEIERDARANHQYTTHTGKLEKAIDFHVADDVSVATIWLSKTKSNAPYAWKIHENYLKGYGHWTADGAGERFLYKAFEKRKPETAKNLEAALVRGFNKAGL